MTKDKSNPDVADYDSSDCDYIRYWEKRQYEHHAEKIALGKLLPQEGGGKMVDLGGGYGRLTPFYAPYFDEVLVLDISRRHLQQAQVMIGSLDLNNVQVKEGDLKNLPLKSEDFDLALMVRVLHHIEHPERVFEEVNRILKPGGVLVVEFPNKCHFKAVWRNFLRGHPGFCFNRERYQQPAAGDEGIFYNYHPQQIRQFLIRAGFKIENKRSASNLRSPFLKRVLPLRLMLILERIAQTLLTCLNFGPSIFLRCRKLDGLEGKG